MAFSRLVYEAEAGGTETVDQGEQMPFNQDLKVVNIKVGEAGKWVIVEYENTSNRSEDSLMIPKERVIRLGGPESLS